MRSRFLSLYARLPSPGHVSQTFRSQSTSSLSFSKTVRRATLPSQAAQLKSIRSTGNRKQVWYSDGVKEDEHALELYYEEYCYRHHKKEVASSKGELGSSLLRDFLSLRPPALPRIGRPVERDQHCNVDEHYQQRLCQGQLLCRL